MASVLSGLVLLACMLHYACYMPGKQALNWTTNVEDGFISVCISRESQEGILFYSRAIYNVQKQYNYIHVGN